MAPEGWQPRPRPVATLVHEVPIPPRHRHALPKGSGYRGSLGDVPGAGAGCQVFSATPALALTASVFLFPVQLPERVELRTVLSPDLI